MPTSKPLFTVLLIVMCLGASCGGGTTSPSNPPGNPPPNNNPPPAASTQFVVVGETNSTNYPTLNALHASFSGSGSGFVSSFSVTASSQLAFSTYFGNTGATQVRDIFIDDAGNIYVTGRTDSSALPTTTGAMLRTYQGGVDAFVAKFSPTGQLLLLTYLGGSTHDAGYSILVDTAGFIYVSGRTSGNFPVTPGALQTTYGGGNSSTPPYFGGDFFIAKMRPDASGLVWATYVGGSGDDTGRGRMVIDSNGNIIVSGDAGSSNFPGVATPLRGSADGVVVKVSANGSQLLYARLVGGTEPTVPDTAAGGVAVNSAGEAYVCGATTAPDLPSPIRSYGGQIDAYAMRLSPTGQILQATYLGGAAGDSCHGVVMDAAGNPVFLLLSSSTNITATTGAFQSANAGGTDYVVMKLSPDLSQNLMVTFVGGSADEAGDTLRIQLDASGNIYFGGSSISGNFPLTSGALRTTNAGSEDGVVVKLSADGRQLLYSTLLGGSGLDRVRSMRFRIN